MEVGSVLLGKEAMLSDHVRVYLQAVPVATGGSGLGLCGCRCPAPR